MSRYYTYYTHKAIHIRRTVEKRLPPTPSKCYRSWSILKDLGGVYGRIGADWDFDTREFYLIARIPIND